MPRQRSFIKAIAVSVLAAVLIPAVCAAETDPEVATLEVVGRARIALEANTAILSFAVVTSARAADDAIKANAQKTQTLLDRLRRQMGPDDKVNTARFSLQPVYEKGNRYLPEGYRVENQVTLKTRLLDRVGTFIDNAVEAGADRIGQLHFSSDKEMEHRIVARETAVENARRQARELAAAAQVGLVRILKIRELEDGGPAPVRMAAEAGMRRVPTPVVPGELEVESAVRIVYEIR